VLELNRLDVPDLSYRKSGARIEQGGTDAESHEFVGCGVAPFPPHVLVARQGCGSVSNETSDCFESITESEIAQPLGVHALFSWSCLHATADGRSVCAVAVEEMQENEARLQELAVASCY
jgi:hypothetical protein